MQVEYTITCHRIAMHGPPFPSDHWSPTSESIYKSPKKSNEKHQAQHPQSHNNARSTDYNHLSPSILNAASEVPMFGYYWPLHDLASYGMAVPTDSTSDWTALPIHTQDVEYSHTHHPHDRLNVHCSVAPPTSFEPAYIATHASQPTPSQPTSKPEQPTQGLLDNETNLKNMRHERELVFETAATERDRVKCDTGSSAPYDKAWEDAWETLRERMTKM